MVQLFKIGIYAAIMATGAMIGIYADTKIQGTFEPDEVSHSDKNLNLMRIIGLVVFLLGHHLLLVNTQMGGELLKLFSEDGDVGKFASVATAGAVIAALVLSFMGDYRDENEGKTNDTFTKVMRGLGIAGVVGVGASMVLPMFNKKPAPYMGMYGLQY